MRLTLDTPVQPDPALNTYDLHTIYELDLQAAITAGETIVDPLLNKICKGTPSPVSMCKFQIDSAQINRYMSTKIPVNPWSENDILCSRISPYAVVSVPDVGDIYKPDSAYYTFEAVEQSETAPEDWATASNYFEYTTQTTSSHTWECWFNVKKSASYDKTKQYYKDVGRNAIKMFYTATGYSFCVYRCGQIQSSSQKGPILVSIGGESHISTGGTAKYNITKPDGTILYYYNSGDSGTSSVCGAVTMGSSYSGSNSEKVKILEGTDPGLYGASTSMCFVHFVYRDPEDPAQISTDYYGIALIKHESFAAYAMPTSIKVIAFTPGFWGDSVIPGGDAGSWGKDAAPGGGYGTFTAPSDNRGDKDGNELETDINIRRGNLYNLCSGASGYKIHQINTSDMQAIFAALYSTNYFTKWKNSFYNPLSAVLAIHLIPSLFIEQSAASSRLTASGFDVSAEISELSPPTFPELAPIVHKNIAAYDLGMYFDAFPDFAPYTKIFLHLPYIGVQEIDTNAVQHGMIAVDYVCDLFQGNVAAYVWCKDRNGACTYKYCASGNVAYSIPLYANAQDGSALGKLLTAGIGLAAGAATGNPLQMIGAAEGMIASAMDRSTQTKGQFSGNAGMIMDTVCYLEIIRPDWVNPSGYQSLAGITSMMSGTLSDDGSDDHTVYQGFVQCTHIETDQIAGATDQERQEIEALLQAGVYLPIQ